MAKNTKEDAPSETPAATPAAAPQAPVKSAPIMPKMAYVPPTRKTVVSDTPITEADYAAMKTLVGFAPKIGERDSGLINPSLMANGDTISEIRRLHFTKDIPVPSDMGQFEPNRDQLVALSDLAISIRNAHDGKGTNGSAILLAKKIPQEVKDAAPIVQKFTQPYRMNPDLVVNNPAGKSLGTSKEAKRG